MLLEESMDGKKENVEFRYYEMPMGRFDLALLGEKWITTYRTGVQHFHNYFEIGYCYEGGGILYLGEEIQKYNPGTISLIPANYPHGVHSAVGNICHWEFLYIDIFGFIEKCSQGDSFARAQIFKNIIQSPLLISKKEYPRLANVIKSILDENREQQIFCKEAINGYLYVLIQEMIRLNKNVSLEQNKNDSNIEKIRPALIYVEANYGCVIKIKQLAEICNISEPYFRKLFVNCMNTSPLEYINTIRIQKACEFLQKEDISMNMLAWKVGFSSVSTFERNFKKIVGESPKKWKLKGKVEKEFVSYNTRVLKGWD